MTDESPQAGDSGPNARPGDSLVDEPGARRLIGSAAIVTGAAHGIGRVYARRLAAEGARVAVVDLDADAARAVADEISARGAEAIAVRTDITDAQAVSDLVSTVRDAFGGVDILVNNAAMFSVVPMSRDGFEALAPDEWNAMMTVNLTGLWHMCRAVVPLMREKGYGKIVNISSGTALKGSSTRLHYVTSKAGVIGFTKSLAREVGPAGIRVNCVAPGSTLSEEDASDEVIARRSERLGDRCIKRLQYPEDLAGAVAFFCSRDSDFVTGQTLVVDGGVVMP